MIKTITQADAAYLSGLVKGDIQVSAAVLDQVSGKDRRHIANAIYDKMQLVKKLDKIRTAE